MSGENELPEAIACIEKLPGSVSVHYLDSLEKLAKFAAEDGKRQQQLQELIRDARLRPGPFLVCTSATTAGGESLIRNLLLGQRITGQLGISNRYVLLAGLTPFDRQVPQILQNFNIDGVYIDWRGSRSGDLFKVAEWQGPDQSHILVIGFPRLPQEALRAIYAMDPDVMLPDAENIGCELQMLTTNTDFSDFQGNGSRFPSNLIDLLWAVKERIDPKKIRTVEIGAICVDNGTQRVAPEFSYQYRVHHYHLQAYLQTLVEPLQVLTECIGIHSAKISFEENWKRLLFGYQNGQSEKAGRMLNSLQAELQRQYSDCLAAVQQNIRIEPDSPDDSYLMVWNPLAVKRTQILPATISIPKRDNLDNFILEELSGREVKYQILDRREVEPRFGEDGDQRLLQFEVIAELRNIPPMGYAVYRITPRHTSREYRGKKISEETHQLENEYIRVTIAEDGSFSVFSKETGSSYEHLGRISDEKWQNGFKQDHRSRHQSSSRATKVERLYNGSLQAAYHIHHSIRQNHALPQSSSNGETDVTDIHIILRLHRNSRFVEIDLDVIERCSDHRVWMHFPVDFRIENHSTGGFFSTVFRQKNGKVLVPRKGNHERLSAIDWIGFSDDLDGYAIFLDGYAEYRRNQDDLDVAILLSENGMQNGSHQRVRRRFAFYPYLGSWECGQLLHDHRAWRWGFSISQNGRPQGELPDKASFLNLQPGDAVFSSIKWSEDGDGIIVRIHNPTDQFIKAKLQSFLAIRKASLCTLEELPLQELSIRNVHLLGFEMEAYKIVTLRLCFDRSDAIERC